MGLKFSIVIPSYNQAVFLEQTLKSIFAQDYTNYEVIVMDGASKDGSQEVIEQYASRLAYWQSKADGGQTAAIQAGFEMAQGDIFAWLNSDDAYLPGAFSKVASFFEKHPGVETVTGGGFIVDAEGNPTRVYRVNYTLGVAASGARFRYYSQNGIYQPSTFWRKEAYQAVGGVDPSFHFTMDRDLFLRLSARKKFGRVPSMLSAFRMHGENKSVKMLEVHDREVLIMNKKYGLDKEPFLKRKLFFVFYQLETWLFKSWWVFLKMIGVIKVWPVQY